MIHGLSFLDGGNPLIIPFFKVYVSAVWYAGGTSIRALQRIDPTNDTRQHSEGIREHPNRGSKAT
jgi:hypothetical protein